MASFGTTQSFASRILGHLRQANVQICEASDADQKWYDLATKFEAAAKLIPVDKEANLTILANIGVQYGELQKSVAQEIETGSGVDVHACLMEMEASLSSGGGSGPYLIGNGSSISTCDLALVCALRKLLSLLYTIRPYPSVGNWFSACCSLDGVVAELGDQRAVGTKRIGGQIDRRPEPKEAFAAATQSITLNKGQKKKVTQRQKEKAAKKESKQQQGGSKKQSATESKEAAPAKVNNIVTEVPATHEAAHANLLEQLNKISTIKQETKQSSDIEEEIASWAKSLFLKDKKKKALFMFTTPANASPPVSLKALSKALGVKELRMAGPKDMKSALGYEKGCITAMSVLNDSACKVTSVLDSRLKGRMLHMCTGCDDALDHSQHHISEQDYDSLVKFLNACGHSPTIYEA